MKRYNPTKDEIQWVETFKNHFKRTYLAQGRPVQFASRKELILSHRRYLKEKRKVRGKS